MAGAKTGSCDFRVRKTCLAGRKEPSPRSNPAKLESPLGSCGGLLVRPVRLNLFVEDVPWPRKEIKHNQLPEVRFLGMCFFFEARRLEC